MMRPPRANESGGGSGNVSGVGGSVTGNGADGAGVQHLLLSHRNTVLTPSRPVGMASSVFADNSGSSNGHPLGVFDEQYFPEITQEASSSDCYRSPISEIIHEIQRTNTAAATVGGSGTGSGNVTSATTMNNNIMWAITGDSGLSSSDPWAVNNYGDGGGGGDFLYGNESSLLYQSRLGGGDSGGTGLWLNSPIRQSRVGSAAASAGGGGEQATAAVAENSTGGNQNRRLSSRNLSIGSHHHHRRGKGAVGGGAGDFKNPQHALHLLQDTPQFRFVSPQSTDMNGSSGGRGDGHPFSRHYAMLQRVILRQDKSKDTIVSVSSSHHRGGGLSGAKKSTSAQAASGSGGEYHHTLVRQRANQKAASELSSLLWTLAHEMSLEGYGAVESQVLSAVFALVHDASSKDKRMAGLAA
jgi:hypothetical protein